ncbi:hypothetical protein LOK49_LG06G01658 [Camellia lanceoleosa]|uniref:Uncharacterized protein n=1 Tax=Camellia lanceoleosa TaxID=1840588 RepID=A0ACC0HER8_9ERIC|nr:hypothetical protein LOK49_LG06G01658 [Camellia lanceoleosa]
MTRQLQQMGLLRQDTSPFHLTPLVLLSLSDPLRTAAVDAAENSFPMSAIDAATDFPLPGHLPRLIYTIM